METEEFEHVPWSALLAEDGRSRVRLYYLAAGVVIAVAIGFAVSKLMSAPGVGPAAAPPVVVSSSAVPVADSATPVSTSAAPPTTTTVVEGPVLYSEADLMAVAPDAEEAIAKMRAEWFVTDYFTVDGDEVNRLDAGEALPAGVADAPIGASSSYVEWARSHHVEPLGAGRFRITVAFRSIAAPPGGEYRRQPVRAVDVVVAVDGPHAAVEDLPAPAEAPEWFDIEPHSGLVSGDLAAAPAGAVAAAVAQAQGWGNSATPVSASPTSTGWRIVVMVEDSAGGAWPMAVEVAG